MITIEMLRDWQRHPVSQELATRLVEHIKGLRDMAAYTDWKPEIIHKLYTIRGEIEAFEALRDVDAFFSSKITKEEIRDDEETRSV